MNEQKLKNRDLELRNKDLTSNIMQLESQVNPIFISMSIFFQRMTHWTLQMSKSESEKKRLIPAMQVREKPGLYALRPRAA